MKFLFLTCLTSFFFVNYSLFAQPTCIKYQSAFDDVLAIAKISSAELEFKCSESVNNAKLSTDSKSSVIINPSYFSKFSHVVFTAAICHEIGHFKANHRTSGDNKQELQMQELEADEYCGFYMRKLGFSRIEEAYEVLNTASTSDSGQYPSKEKRKDAILKGWKKASEESNVINYASYNPRVTWKIHNGLLLITIDDRIIKFKKWFNHGAVYDSLTNSTFQLLEYSNKRNAFGIGRIITNKTNITYRRNTKSGFSIYENGREIPKIECQPNNPVLKGDNLEFVCYNNILKTNITYLLKDFKYAPLKYFMPAFTK